GAPLALLLYRTDLPLRGLFRAVLLLPAAIPPFIWGMGWLSLASPRSGFLNQLFGAGTFDPYGAGGIAFVMGLAGLPLVLLPAAAALGRIDPSLEDAARISGAGPLRALFTTTLPLAAPSILSGGVMVFLFAASAFGVPYMLGIAASPPTPVLTTRIYGELLMGGAERMDRALLLSGVLLGLALPALWAGRVLGRAGRVRLASGKGLASRPVALGRWRAPLGGAVALVAVGLVLLPLGAVFLTSIQRTFGAPLDPGHLTLSHWAQVLRHPRTLQAGGTSLLLAAGAGGAIAVIGLWAALVGRSSRVGRAVEGLAALPSAVPGTVLAIALLVAFSRDLRFVLLDRIAFVLALSGSLWLVAVSYVAKYLVIGSRGLAEGLAQLDPSLTESARIFGAGPYRAFRDAALPALWPALVAAALLGFLTCATEITLSVLLMPAGRDVLGTLLFELQSYADPPAASVLASSVALLVLLAQGAQALVARRWLRPD
ncbi:MAG TPA: iron ABC transporter permease, partial [Longimicrobium sp.]|nr:iron ABC transporter permease [Longimicrobium sp.]